MLVQEFATRDSDLLECDSTEEAQLFHEHHKRKQKEENYQDDNECAMGETDRLEEVFVRAHV